MKKLSLIAFGFDNKLAEVALEAKNYDVAEAYEYCRIKSGDIYPPITESDEDTP